MTAITLNANLFFLSGHVSPSQIGVFAAASSLSVAVLSVSGAFRTRVQSALFGDEPRLQFWREVRILVAASALVGVVGGISAPLLVSVLLGEGYQSALWPMRILAIAAGALMIVDCIHGAMVVLVPRMKMNGVAAMGALSLVLASIAIVPALGIIGAALATLIAYCVVATTGLIVVSAALRGRISKSL